MKLIEWLLPPPRWRIPVVIVLGALSGLILYTAYVSRATSYQSDSPTTCVNWHVVAPQYATWSHRAHREDTADLVQDVVDRQDKIIQSRDKLEELLVHAHVEANRACDLDATEAQIRDILQDIRHALWRCDYAAASQGGSFHSPVEIGRVISAGLPIVADARLELARLLAEWVTVSRFHIQTSRLRKRHRPLSGWMSPSLRPRRRLSRRICCPPRTSKRRCAKQNTTQQVPSRNSGSFVAKETLYGFID